MTATCPACGFVAFVRDDAERDWFLRVHSKIRHRLRLAYPVPRRPPGLDTYRDDVFGREN